MTLSNSQFQIFFNKNPIIDHEKASPLLPSVKITPKVAEQTTKFNLSFGGVYQSTSFNYNTIPSEIQNIHKNSFSNDFLQGNTSSHIEQAPVSSFNGHFSPLNVANLYAEETFDYEGKFSI